MFDKKRRKKQGWGCTLCGGIHGDEHEFCPDESRHMRDTTSGLKNDDRKSRFSQPEFSDKVWFCPLSHTHIPGAAMTVCECGRLRTYTSSAGNTVQDLTAIVQPQQPYPMWTERIVRYTPKAVEGQEAHEESTEPVEAPTEPHVEESSMDDRVDRYDGTSDVKRAELSDSRVSEESSAVNHPSHYNEVPGIECIEVVEHFDFCRGNAIKYLWRAGSKGDVVEDLKKAVWYIEREIQSIEKKRSE